MDKLTKALHDQIAGSRPSGVYVTLVGSGRKRQLVQGHGLYLEARPGTVPVKTPDGVLWYAKTSEFVERPH